MNAVSLFVLDRTFATKDNGMSYEWEINRDYLTQEKSKFRPFKKLNAQQGDFLIVKAVNPDLITRGSTIGGQFFGLSSSSILYLGMVDSLEDEDIVTVDFLSVLNFDFLATRKTGNSAELHLYNLYYNNFKADPSKAFAATIQYQTATTSGTEKVSVTKYTAF